MNNEDRQYKLLVWVGKGALFFIAFVILGTFFQGLMPAKDLSKENTPKTEIKEVKREKQKISGKVTAKIDYIKRCEIDLMVNNRISTFEVDRGTFNKAVIGSYMELEY